ncbi:hypothetical protein AKJ16_DCAP02867 [Drosera capensis]
MGDTRQLKKKYSGYVPESERIVDTTADEVNRIHVLEEQELLKKAIIMSGSCTEAFILLIKKPRRTNKYFNHSGCDACFSHNGFNCCTFSNIKCGIWATIKLHAMSNSPSRKGIIRRSAYRRAR